MSDQLREEICSICHDTGTYYEDVAGDGGSRMPMACECIPPHILRKVLDRTREELTYIDLHHMDFADDKDVDKVAHSLAKHLHKVLAETYS